MASALNSSNSFFPEREEVLEDVRRVLEATDAVGASSCCARIVQILDRYQEQPTLLDSALPAIVTPIMQRSSDLLRSAFESKQAGMSEATAVGLLSSASGYKPFPHVMMQFHAGQSGYLQELFALVYRITKVRGYKSVLKLFPHAVADLEPALDCLLSQQQQQQQQQDGGGAGWETRYILLLWLSVLVLVPFDLSTIDSAAAAASSSGAAAGSGGGGGGVVSLLLRTCREILCEPGKPREAAALCISKLLSRPDMDASRLKEFCGWAAEALVICTNTNTTTTAGSTASVTTTDGAAAISTTTALGAPVSAAVTAASSLGRSSEAAFVAAATAHLQITTSSISGASRIFLATGVMQALVEISKHGHRLALLDSLAETLSRVLEILGGGSSGGSSSSGDVSKGSYMSGSSPLLRKLLVKFASRTALQYLPPRLAKWRYERGRRVLLAGAAGASNIAAASTAASSSSGGSAAPAAEHANDDDDDDIDIPIEIEATLDMLLTGLRDTDTVVRWSAAKGVGRVTARLPKLFADDVVKAVLDLLTPAETDSSWHGGCLALAELARRGLLLPSRLGLAIPRVLAALQYDVRRGAHSVGAHVRDAACYVCWAFARAYDPQVMKPHVLGLARGMLLTALFDREVNCRRAASAAFQENVGRQGHQNFPDGIAILTLADYFSLGNRSHAFTVVAPQVAAFPTYRYALLEHLLTVKIKHWDKDIRTLAAQALSRMCAWDAEWFKEVAIPALLPQVTSADLFARHGSILALAEICLGLAQVPTRVHPTLLDQVRNVVVKAEKARVYTGRGGEAVRVAMCRLIACQCLADHPISKKAAVRFLQTIDDCLKHPNEAVQEGALEALRAVTLTPSLNTGDDQSVIDRLPKTYLLKLNSDDNPAVRRGLALALGALPRAVLCSPLPLKRSEVAYSSPPLRKGQQLQQAQQPSSLPADMISVLDAALDSLILATKQEKQAVKRDAETRRNAVVGLTELICTVGFGARKQATTTAAAAGADGASLPSEEHLDGHLRSELLPGLSALQFCRVWDALHAATFDYATDNRGDVGSWVRKAALEGMERLLRAMQAALAAEEGQLNSEALCVSTPSLRAEALTSRLASAHSSPLLGSYVSFGAVCGVVSKVVACGIVVEVSRISPPSAPAFPYGSAIVRAESVTPLARAAAASISISLDDDSVSFLRAFLSDRSRVTAQFVGPLLRIACEKLDLLRGVAGDILCRVLHPKPGAPSYCLAAVAQLGALQQVFVAPAETATSPEGAEQAEHVEAGGDDISQSHGHSQAAAANAAVEDRELQWSLAHHSFPRIVALLACDCDCGDGSTSGNGAATASGACDCRFVYTPHLASGLVTAVGGLSESVVRQSSAAVAQWVKAACTKGDVQALKAVAGAVCSLLKPRPLQLWDIHVDGAGAGGGGGFDVLGAGSVGGGDASISRWFKEILGVASGRGDAAAGAGSTGKGAGVGPGQRVDSRLLTPALRTLDLLLQQTEALDALSDPGMGVIDDLLHWTKHRAYSAAEDATRIATACDVCLTLLAARAAEDREHVRREAAFLILDALGHPFPKVRRQLAEKLYVRLLTVGTPAETSTGSSDADAALAILSQTAWDGPLGPLVARRDELYAALGLPMPASRSGVDPAVFADANGHAESSFGAGGGDAGGADGDAAEDRGYGSLVKDAGY